MRRSLFMIQMIMKNNLNLNSRKTKQKPLKEDVKNDDFFLVTFSSNH